ncbi:MAG: glycoside hydrolase family 3 C-terminal domain-containing protein [Lachnospiraceae bacterium]|nr:glycoside hydrolase family 3 C-terminal domain-containing protein [Lachnospiraceae bacterium]
MGDRNNTKWSRFRYTPGLPLYGEERVTSGTGHLTLSEVAAGEGIVLLKNDGALPLAGGTRVALFGKATFDYVKGGGGSGDVNVSHTVNIYDGLKAFPDWIRVSEATIPFYRGHVEKELAEGKLPGFVSEPALPGDLLKKAAAEADVAIISICRYSGEGWDRKTDQSVRGESVGGPGAEDQSAMLFERGDFYLSKAEQALVAGVKKAFSRVVVLLNVGGVIESEWFASDKKINAVLLTGQGGICGGRAAAAALLGVINPSGRLIDTWAADIEDYPSTKGFFKSDAYVEYEEDIFVGYRYFSTIKGADERVVYPFGYGMGYSDFDLESMQARELDGAIEAEVTVVNRGPLPGKEVLQLYAELPQGKLGKPARTLAAFAKTKLLMPGDSQRLLLRVKLDDLASYDDTGKVKKSAWILEKGNYRFYLGTNVRDAWPIEYEYVLTRDRIVKQLTEKIAPKALKRRLTADGRYEKLETSKTSSKNEAKKLKPLPLSEWDGYAPAARAIPQRFVYQPDKSVHSLDEVADGRLTMSAFMKQLTDEDLIWMFSGQPNTGVANTWGFGNNERFGIPNVMTADGPAGLRTQAETGVTTTAWPVASTLAATWNTELVTAVGEAAAEEVKENNIGVWLAPAINIHRSPFCGRNFEYFSEDPFLTGIMAAAVIRGVQSKRIGATIKHFAFNNKETNRRESDSRVSERAAREIYLKGFEIAIRESDPWCVMTSYNLVNGEHTSSNEELLTGILRGEWGYEGLIMTDWWSTGDPYRDLLAGIDLRMPNGVPDRIRAALDKGLISRKDLERSAKRILELLLKLD